MSTGAPDGGSSPDRRRALAAVALLCVAVLALGWWSKARCLDDGGWSDGEEYLGWCYTDVYPLWFAERLDAGAVPYRDHPVEYPVLTGAQMWLGAQVAGRLAPDHAAVAFFHVTAAGGAAAVLATLWLLARAGLPPHRLVWWAGAPTLAFVAFVNWDPVPVALAVGAVVAHLKGRDGLAGVAAGLGAAAKLYPGLLVPVIAAARIGQRRYRDALLHTGAAAGAWLAVNVPVWLAAPDGWRRFFELNRERTADWDSLWYLAERLRGAPLDVGTVNLASAAAFAVGAVVIAVVGGRRRPPARWWELALPLLAWFLLTNKVYSPQFSLWLLPLLALALPGAAPFLAFLAADAAVFLVRFPFLGGLAGYEPAPDYPWLGAAVAVRAVVLVWVVVASVRGSPSSWAGVQPPPAGLDTGDGSTTGSGEAEGEGDGAGDGDGGVVGDGAGEGDGDGSTPSGSPSSSGAGSAGPSASSGSSSSGAGAAGSGTHSSASSSSTSPSAHSGGSGSGDGLGFVTCRVPPGLGKLATPKSVCASVMNSFQTSAGRSPPVGSPGRGRLLSRLPIQTAAVSCGV